jgi:hypothetical protein
MTTAHKRGQGIAYSVIPDCDKTFFRCDRHAAKLSTESCASMYREGNHTDEGLIGGRLAKCRSCPLGATHAGEELSIFSRWYGTDICPRCGKGTTRMIQDRICVSCRNREYEMIRGRNAKGTAPVNLRRLYPMILSYTLNGHPRRYRAPLATSILETIVQVLRVTKGKVTFAFKGDDSRHKQRRLL